MSDDFLTPQTELEAVNTMMAMIGELPLNDIEEIEAVEGSIALSLLRSTCRDTQGRGLHCNTEEDFPLPVDVNGFINIPVNAQVLRVSDSSMDVAQRGSKLYDRIKHTFIFTAPVLVDILFFLGFQDLPNDVRTYIAMRAGRIFVRRQLGDADLSRITMEDELTALSEMRANEEVRQGNNFRYSSRAGDHNVGVMGRL